LDLIEKKLGVLALLDEECRFPNGSDKSFLTKLHKVAETDERYKEYYFSTKLTASVGFGVNHYAGPVDYNVKDFLTKVMRKMVNFGLYFLLTFCVFLESRCGS
jgi:myosin heavy subunit